jgi:hypothetical protein
MLRYILGPELFWLLMYFAATIISRMNHPATKAMDDFIEKCWFWIPVVSLLVFSLWWIPEVEKKWLLLRVIVFGIIGGHLVLEKTLSAYSNQGPGIGMGYLAGIMLHIFLLVAGSIFVVIRFWK